MLCNERVGTILLRFGKRYSSLIYYSTLLSRNRATSRMEWQDGSSELMLVCGESSLVSDIARDEAIRQKPGKY